MVGRLTRRPAAAELTAATTIEKTAATASGDGVWKEENNRQVAKEKRWRAFLSLNSDSLSRTTISLSHEPMRGQVSAYLPYSESMFGPLSPPRPKTLQRLQLDT